MIHECLLPGCGKKLSRRFHFCKGHWDLVPKRLQDAVINTYAKYQREVAFDPVRNELHRKQWQLARGVAVVAVQHALGQITAAQMARVIGNRPAEETLQAEVLLEITGKETTYADFDENSGRDDQDR